MLEGDAGRGARGKTRAVVGAVGEKAVVAYEVHVRACHEGGEAFGWLGNLESRDNIFPAPVGEIMQHKGSSECALGVNTEDELCDFEPIPRFPMFGVGLP